jgi:hypothetical protein
MTGQEQIMKEYHLNKERLLTSIILGAIVLQLSGCATPAEVSSMTAYVNSNQQAAPTSPYINNIVVSSVSGGSETNPLWTSQVSSEDFKAALENTLRSAKLLSTSEGSRYQLAAEIKALDQPLIGFTMTVNMTVQYMLKDKQTGSVVFRDQINSSFTSTVGDAFVGSTRLRITNEGAVRNNFDLLLKKLLKQ